jgi:hypothetical protein
VRTPLRGFTDVLDEGDAAWIRLVEPGLEVGQQACRGALQRGSIGPPAMAAELLLDVAPDTFHEVQLGCIRRQPQATHPVVMRHPPVLGKPTLVIADIVQHDDQRAI